MLKQNNLFTNNPTNCPASGSKSRQPSAMPAHGQLPVALHGYKSARSAMKSPVMLTPDALHEQRKSHILNSVPVLGDPALDGFFGDVFGDRSLCDAYLLAMPEPVVSLTHPTLGGHVIPTRLALDQSIAEMNVILNRAELSKRDRCLGAVAAFFAPCGWYLKLNQSDTASMGQRTNLNALRELRVEALRYPLRALRKSRPELVVALTAVWDPVKDDDDWANANQVQRIRSVVMEVCGWL